MTGKAMKIIINKRRVEFMGGKPLFTTLITANAHNVSVGQFLPKAPKSLCILKKKKTYYFNDSMGTDHQIFMVTFPKIKVCSLRLQRICFVEFQGKPFLIVFYLWMLFYFFCLYIFSKHCYLAWHTHSQSYYENPGILGGTK